MTVFVKERLVVAALLLCCTPLSVIAQKSNSEPTDAKTALIEYRPGQVWRTPFGAMVTVLVVEDVHKGKIVHVRIDNVQGQSCGSVHISTQLDHLAFSEKIMRKSHLVLIKDDVEIPDSYLDSYREWAKKKHHEIAKIPVQDEIMRVAGIGGPMICNFVPEKA